jgi:hypothetical protein
MFRRLLGKVPIWAGPSFFSEQEPQPVFEQFYDLRIFLVGDSNAYRPEYLVVHWGRVKKDDT